MFIRTRSIHALFLAAVLLAITLAGCTGGGGGGDETLPTRTGDVNVLLEYTDARTAVPEGGVSLKVPDDADSFLIEILNINDGSQKAVVTVDRQYGVDTQSVLITGITIGTYNLKVTAYNAGGQIIGIYETQISVLATIQIVPVPSVSPVVPTSSPSPSPIVSPSATLTPLPN